MTKKMAVRNLRLCTKDCLCLYVCPTGASDTENSIIDIDKCIGCGMCADACPSGAISMVPLEYPAQQKKDERVLAYSHVQTRSKSRAEKIASQLAENADNSSLYRLMKAVEKSLRLVNEDLIRESGYMLPQSRNAHDMLREWVKNPPSDDFPVRNAKKLLDMLPENDGSEDDGRAETARTYRCTVCGHVFGTADGEEPVCPMCGASGDRLELIESGSV